jgi:hypothetical protein
VTLRGFIVWDFGLFAVARFPEERPLRPKPTSHKIRAGRA